MRVTSTQLNFNTKRDDSGELYLFIVELINFLIIFYKERVMNLLQIIGYLFVAFGLIDYSGNIFDFDLTGVSWSPMAAGFLGVLLVGVGSKDESGDKKY
jgi:hypothetical protein